MSGWQFWIDRGGARIDVVQTAWLYPREQS